MPATSVGPPGGGPDRRAVSPPSFRGACGGADPGRSCPCRLDRRRCQLEGCGAVRVGPSTLRRQLGWHCGAGSPAARGHDGLGDTGLSVATCLTQYTITLPTGSTHPPTVASAGLHPFKLEAGVPVGLARADRQLGRHGPARVHPLSHAIISRTTTHPATGPLTSAHHAFNRRRGISLAGDSDATRRLGPPSTGRPLPRWDSDARGPSHQVPRRQVPTVTLHELDHDTRPSAIKREPEPRARPALI